MLGATHSRQHYQPHYFAQERSDAQRTPHVPGHQRWLGLNSAPPLPPRDTPQAVAPQRRRGAALPSGKNVGCSDTGSLSALTARPPSCRHEGRLKTRGRFFVLCLSMSPVRPRMHEHAHVPRVVTRGPCDTVVSPPWCDETPLSPVCLVLTPLVAFVTSCGRVRGTEGAV